MITGCDAGGGGQPGGGQGTGGPGSCPCGPAGVGGGQCMVSEGCGQALEEGMAKIWSEAQVSFIVPRFILPLALGL